MAYSAPELLLIGAAQHLVLETSALVTPPDKSQVVDEDCRTGIIEDNPGLEYDLEGGW